MNIFPESSMQKNPTSNLGAVFLKKVAGKVDMVEIDQQMEVYKREVSQIHPHAQLFFDTVVESTKGGKKLRAGLLHLGYELSGATQSLDISSMHVAIEIFHAALLIHDDIMDRDETRRGQDSLHVAFTKVAQKRKLEDPSNYGLALAILAGDLGFYLSWSLLARSSFSDQQFRAVSTVYADYARRIVYGQVLDMGQESLKNLNAETVLTTMRMKTAEYTGVLPLEWGARLGGMPESEIEKLREYGLAFGWAFQVQDDVLGLFGKEETLGKPIGSDLREGKKTLLMLELFKRVNKQEKQQLLRLLGKKDLTSQELSFVTQLLTHSGALQAVLDMGWQFVEKACTAADSLSCSDEHKDTLKSLATYMMQRTQ